MAASVTCGQCGREAQPGQSFCENCGASLVDAASSRSEPNATRGHGRWLVWVGAVVVLLALVGAASYFYLELQDTEERLSATEANLEDTATTLGATEEELSTTEESLEERTLERDRLDTRVRDLKNDIQGVRGSLDLAQTDLELQAGQISSLKTCLNGVSIAFEHVLVENYPAAAAALESVEAPCNEAFGLL